MNRYFEFTKTQMRMLVVLAILILLAGSYKLVRDYYLKPSQAPRKWRVEVLDQYQSLLIVDLNHAPADSLELLPGIGPVLSQRIIEYRQTYGQFRSVDSLINVEGIGSAKLQTIRKYLKVSLP